MSDNQRKIIFTSNNGWFLLEHKKRAIFLSVSIGVHLWFN